MAVTDSAKLDYLWKKLGYGLTKTDTPANKEAFNESIPSPLLARGDRVWQQSALIANVQPTTGNTAVVAIYNDSGNGAATVECTEDITASHNRTWKTNLTDWIPTEFASTILSRCKLPTWAVLPHKPQEFSFSRLALATTTNGFLIIKAEFLILMGQTYPR